MVKQKTFVKFQTKTNCYKDTSKCNSHRFSFILIHSSGSSFMGICTDISTSNLPRQVPITFKFIISTLCAVSLSLSYNIYRKYNIRKLSQCSHPIFHLSKLSYLLCNTILIVIKIIFNIFSKALSVFFFFFYLP